MDDASDMSHLAEELETYMSQYPKVKIIRAKERTGLIRARMMGAAKATAPGRKNILKYFKIFENI